MNLENGIKTDCEHNISNISQKKKNNIKSKEQNNPHCQN